MTTIRTQIIEMLSRLPQQYSFLREEMTRKVLGTADEAVLVPDLELLGTFVPADDMVECHEPVSDDSADRLVTANGVSFHMKKVMGGTFTMGDSCGQSSDTAEESEMRKVTLSDYWIGETTVTQELWRAVMGDNPSSFHGDSNPVENISWNDCQAFVGRLNTLTGLEFRLPSEAQWEFAARGGRNSKGYRYAGADELEEVAWFDDNSSARTHPVATKAPNELGIFDMCGNVWEWCSDWFSFSLYDSDRESSSAHETDPEGPSDGTCRVLRGGAWGCGSWGCRVHGRNNISPKDRGRYFGFRLALAAS